MKLNFSNNTVQGDQNFYEVNNPVINLPEGKSTWDHAVQSFVGGLANHLGTKLVDGAINKIQATGSSYPKLLGVNERLHRSIDFESGDGFR